MDELQKSIRRCMPKPTEPYQIYYWFKGEKFNGRSLAVHGMLHYTNTPFIFKDPSDPKEGPQADWPSFAVPCITCPDGTHIGQSVPVSVKVAKDVGLYPSGELNELRALQVAANAVDMLKEVINVDADKLPNEARTQKWLTVLESSLAANGSTGFFCGSSLTYADFHVFMACHVWSGLHPISVDLRGPLLTVHYAMMKPLLSKILL